MAVDVTREPPGLSECEVCITCRNPTRYWAEFGRYPLCPGCAEKITEPTQEKAET